jgi:hypothetical protein
LDVLKSGSALHATVNEVPEISIEDDVEVIEEMDTEEVTSFAEIMPVSQPHFTAENHDFESIATSPKDKSKRFITRQLFEKLQNYKKITRQRIDSTRRIRRFQKEILSFM